MLGKFINIFSASNFRFSAFTFKVCMEDSPIQLWENTLACNDIFLHDIMLYNKDVFIADKQ